jgi:hypothetical protein
MGAKGTKSMRHGLTAPVGAFTLDGWVPRADFAADNPRLFASEAAVRWFVHRNRARLVKADAILKFGKRHYIKPANFERVMMEVSREQTNAELARSKVCATLKKVTKQKPARRASGSGRLTA